MKSAMIGGLAFGMTLGSLLAQSSSNAPLPALSETNKVELKDLLKLPSFTNDTGMVLVKMSDAYWVGAFEVTQEEYQKIAGTNPSRTQGGRNPVDSVNWNDALGFCVRLTEQEKQKEMLPEGFEYTLPTQAQWEALAAGVDLKDAVTGSGVTRNGSAPVGTRAPNPNGIYDLRGNVWEWCLDPQDKPYRVARGAAWDTFIEVNLRPAFRWYSKPEQSSGSIGFRCVLQPKG